MTLAVVAVVVVALVFAYTNGFHDAPNAVATSVSTRALTPRVAVLLAAVMNFVGALLGAALGQEVADAVTAVVDPPTGTTGLLVVLAALVGAITWNMVTWWRGMPSSSSHALIGGLVGATLAAGATVKWGVIGDTVLVPMLVSPVVGALGAAVLMVALMWGLRRVDRRRTDRFFRLAQTLSAAAMAVGHGLQDAQKTMGVVFLALVVGGYAASGDDLPTWVVLASAGAISVGTLAGGWRIMRTLGQRIVDLDPARGFAAEAVSASVLYTTALTFGAPISTTQTISSAVVGAGATRRVRAVRWSVVCRVLTAWVLTFPAAGLVAALALVVGRAVAA